MNMNLQFFGGRGSSGGKGTGTGASSSSSKSVTIPKTISSKNMTPELYKQIYSNPSSVPVGTQIKYYTGGAGSGNQILKYEGDGVWSYKDMSDGKRFTYKENPYIPEYKGKSAQQISTMEIRKALKKNFKGGR